MSTLKIQATKMIEAEASHISLVDRGANRIPFKIVKQEKEMSKAFAGLDLGSVFARKSEKVAATVAVACMKGENLEAVKAKLVAAGFDVATPVEKEDGSILFMQPGAVLKDDETPTVVRLNEEVALITKGFSPYSMNYASGDSFADQCAAQGFYPGINTVTDTLGDTVRTLVYNAANPSDAKTAVSKVFDEAKAYALSFVGNLPVAAFKFDTTVVKSEVKTEADPEEIAKAAMSADEKKFYGTLEGADKMKFMKGSADVRSAMMEDAADGGKDDGNEDASGKVKGKKADGTDATTTQTTTEATTADAAPDVQALVAVEVSKASEQISAGVKSMLSEFSATIQKSLGDLSTNVTGLQGRMEQAEQVAKAAKDAVTGMVVIGSEQADQAVGTKKQEHQYVGREIDTAFQSGIRKQAARH